MVKGELVTGDGWISDDSSFYGSENEQDRLHSLGDKFRPKHSLTAQILDLNTRLATLRAQSQPGVMSAIETVSMSGASVSNEAAQSSNSFTGNKPPNLLLNRKAMEEAQLARLGKRPRDPSPEPVLFNPGQGSPDAWQLGESVDEFMKRLPPLTTPVFTCPWIWVHNPHFDARDKNKVTSHRADEFRSRGNDVLDQSLQAREQIQSRGLHGPRGVLTKSLNEESKALQQRITNLAVECGIVSGKWMLFPKLEEVNGVWSKVVEGVINNHLGPTAKVAPDEGKPGDRLICIYTKDYRDEEDVLRVLQELEMMGLLPSGRSIYYKSDAFTYLDLYKQTASNFKMMAAARVSKAPTLSGKKQKTLNSYF
ncbi:hypothetical protein BDU57DRAFT_585560 [Ampelomyces quisqualis]|uniref:DUF1917-domain-containing protein n=1 Tax=Ampelomyces quisqualis TaxID=50730 RepID=A0A6A5QVJ0_AMPQU|nr:hypothetical protein BDU57DRAFT_585560 [Ampelomyces quisqualis]